MEITWRAADGMQEDTRVLLAAAGADVRPRSGFEPLTTIAVVVSVGLLVKCIGKMFKDIRYKGLIIDATRQPIEVREMPNWDRSEVLLITASGATFHQFASEDVLAELLSRLGVS
ncbi:hypothetical protein ACFUTV_43630 [Streptomyces sp. NPDC057298]|uniref:hypothetical protein n=1 Tax=Streptomyces sp. NPDC057298 TaxID=3346091 RepID=UPI00362A29B3